MSSYIYLTTTDLYLLQTCAKCLPCLYVSVLLWFIPPPPFPVKLIEADLPSTVFSSSSSALSYLYCQGRNLVGLAKLDFYLLLSCFSFLSRSAFVQLRCQRAVQTCKFHVLAWFMFYLWQPLDAVIPYPVTLQTDQLILNSRRQNLNWIW